MQKLLVLIMTTLISLFTTVILKGQNPKPTETLETKTLNLDRFENINSNMVFDVEILKSNEEKVVITSNYLDFVNVFVKNNVLQIGYKDKSSLQNVKTKIVIYTKAIKSVVATTGSIVKIKDPFEIQKFSTETGGRIYGDSYAKKVNISTQSGGFMLGKVTSEDLVLSAQSGSSIDVQGRSNTAKIACEGASKINASKTTISEANVVAESASSVTLSVSKELTASASSVAKIRYKALSEIKLSTNKDSGGSIGRL